MSIKAKVKSTNQLKGKATQQNQIVAQTLKINAGELSIGDLNDVDATGKVDGAVLIYNAVSGKFELDNNVENENVTITAGLY